MSCTQLRLIRFICLWLCLLGPCPGAQPAFRICSYNVETYLDAPTQSRTPKSPAAAAMVAESLRAAGADVVALQEMGSLSALHQLRATLKTAGMDYPFWEHVTGFDTNIHLAVLSRFPIRARRPHTNDVFLLYGRRYRVSRGFCEVEIQVNSSYRFTLLSAHLKSKRSVSYGDEAELREEEARILRRIVTRKLSRDPRLNLVVLGDFNDTKDSPALRLILGRGKSGLVDTRPAEIPAGVTRRAKPEDARSGVAWTYYYQKEDSYSRIDYILLSHDMARELQTSHIVTLPDWRIASDHRPLVVTLGARDR